jgi:hypothetical protein
MCELTGSYTEVCSDVRLVDLDLQVNKQADAFFLFIFANGKFNLATVHQGHAFCTSVLYGP